MSRRERKAENIHGSKGGHKGEHAVDMQLTCSCSFQHNVKVGNETHLAVHNPDVRSLSLPCPASSEDLLYPCPCTSAEILMRPFSPPPPLARLRGARASRGAVSGSSASARPDQRWTP